MSSMRCCSRWEGTCGVNAEVCLFLLHSFILWPQNSTEVFPEQRSRGSRAWVLSGVCLDEESVMHRSSSCPGLELSMVLIPRIQAALCNLAWNLPHPNPHPSCRVLARTLQFLVHAQDVGVSKCCPEGRPNHPVLPFSHRGTYITCTLNVLFLMSFRQKQPPPVKKPSRVFCHGCRRWRKHE